MAETGSAPGPEDTDDPTVDPEAVDTAAEATDPDDPEGGGGAEVPETVEDTESGVEKGVRIEKAVTERLYGHEKVHTDEDGRLIDAASAAEVAEVHAAKVDELLAGPLKARYDREKKQIDADFVTIKEDANIKLKRDLVETKSIKDKDVKDLRVTEIKAEARREMIRIEEDYQAALEALRSSFRTEAYRMAEATANEKAGEFAGGREGGTAIGREIMARWDAQRATMEENNPVGKWEKVKFFLGGGGERGENYREAKKGLRETEGAKEQLERAEHKYLLMGDEAKAMLLRADTDPSLSPRQKKTLEKRAACMLIKASNERSFIEDRLQPSVKEKLGIDAPVERELGMRADQLTFTRLLNDYPEKAAILNEIAAKAEDPEETMRIIREALVDVASLGFAGTLTTENMDRFVEQQAGKIGKDLAQKIVESGLLEVLYGEKLGEGIENFNSRELFGILDARKRVDLGMRADQAGLRREERKARFVQGWQLAGRTASKFAKGVGAVTVGQELPEGMGTMEGLMNMEGIDYDTPIRDIIEDGSNTYAQILQGVRIGYNVLTPDSVALLTTPLFWAEDKLQLPFRLVPLTERSMWLRTWQSNLEDRRNTSGRRFRDKIERILAVIESLAEINEAKAERGEAAGGGGAPAPATGS